MNSLKDYVNESILDDPDTIWADATGNLLKMWVDKHIKCEGKIIYLKNGTMKVHGDITIRNIDNEYIPDFIKFSEFKGSLTIARCPKLKNLDGIFDPIKFKGIDGHIAISLCPEFNSLRGLPMFVSGNLYLCNLPKLKSLDGMPAIIEHNLYIMKLGKKFTGSDILNLRTETNDLVKVNGDISSV